VVVVADKGVAIGSFLYKLPEKLPKKSDPDSVVATEGVAGAVPMLAVLLSVALPVATGAVRVPGREGVAEPVGPGTEALGVSLPRAAVEDKESVLPDAVGAVVMVAEGLESSVAVSERVTISSALSFFGFFVFLFFIGQFVE
jgi:hypothetical protein